MPARAKVMQLPDEVRQALDKKLAANGFGDYVGLSEWLASQGFEIGKSALGNYGKALQDKLDAISASTKAAVMLNDLFPDDADQQGAATMRLVQTDLFNVMVALQEAAGADPADRVKLLAKAAKAIAEVSRASVNQRKWQDVVRSRVKAAADAVGKIAKSGGMPEAQQHEIINAILGISS